MKNRLEILVGIVAFIFLFSFTSSAQQRQYKWNIPLKGGGTVGTNDADEAKRLIDENKVSKPAGTSSIIDRTHKKNWENEGEQRNYKTGHYEIDRSWIKDQDDGNTKAITAIAGSVMQAGKTATDDPAVGSYIQASGTGFAVLGALERTNHFRKLSNEYENAAEKNFNLMNRSSDEIGALDSARTKAQETADDKNKSKADRAKAQKRVTALTARLTELERAKETQNQLYDQYDSKSTWQTVMSGFGVLQAGALSYVAYQQIQNGRKLADDQKYCEDNPTEFPRCTDVPQSPEDNGPEDTQTGSRNPSNDDPGFTPNDTDLNAPGGFDGESDSNALLQPGGIDGADDASSFLAANGGLTGASGEEKKKDGDSKNGYSDDQTYDDVSADTSVFGSGGYTPSIAGGFDISQFLPSHLRGRDGFAVKRMNKKSKEKKGLVLGKDSPSLFTRVTKAHKAKELELYRGVL